MNVFSFNTVVVGTGAAGFNAADRLFDFGQRDVAIVTEGIHMGTSRNTGSDKQTYYKLTLAGGGDDSVRHMAQTLFDGGCMHGDLALCEAAMSARCFNKLTDIGVPFPHNRYGEFIGYKTDHDPRQRATSAGPLTSRFMTEKLEAQVKAKNIRIFDGYKVIGIITDHGVCKGLLALDKSALKDYATSCVIRSQGVEPTALDETHEAKTCRTSKSKGYNPDKIFVLFNCTNVVLATGGPAGLYSGSVYPESQTGSNGIAFEAGVAGRNLTEWQYGIASIKFRWNLSGSYQQVIPRYVSTDRQGNDAREFLDTCFPDAQRMLDAIFLKGYQWPFDSRKIANCGSSLIDILVHQEIHQKGRRVFLDYLHNPTALQHDFGNLGNESYSYLKQSGALQPTPLERLAHLNRPAIDLYKNNGIDLAHEMLEIAVCAQHNNGGLAVNCWWETNVPHLFAAGEAAGTHGVYRPGGSALNAGQVGSTRAAMFIARRYTDKPMPVTDFLNLATLQIAPKLKLANLFLENRNGLTPQEIHTVLANRMSAFAAHIRHADDLRKVKEEAMAQLLDMTGQAASESGKQTILLKLDCDEEVKTPCKGRDFAGQTALSNPADLVMAFENIDLATAFENADLVTAFENIDLLIAQYVYAAAMENYIASGGSSRGSYIIPDENGIYDIPGSCRFSPDDGRLSTKIQEVYYTAQGCDFRWEDVRPVPEGDDWFENVWRAYREDEVIR